MRPRRGRSAGWRIIALAPGDSRQPCMLSEEKVLTIGRSRSVESAPDINLWPDRLVSRKHASLRLAENVCWLRDLGSKSGTRVDGDAVAAESEIAIQPGAAIECGRSRLLLLGPEWDLANAGPVLVALRLPPMLGFGLGQSNLFSTLHLYNRSLTTVPPGRIELRLGEFAVVAADHPALGPGDSHLVSRAALEMAHSALEAVRERIDREWTLWMGGGSPSGTGAVTSILAYNEVLFAPRHRPAWARLVLPNHPQVTELATSVMSAATASRRPEDALRLVYQVLHSKWRVHYRDEPPHHDSDAQKVRLPHDVLRDSVARAGEGTCLDLALLMASVLESLGVQPIVAILENESKRHAVVGCWKESVLRLEPLLHDPGRLLSGAVWVDPTGCVRDPAERRSIAEAQRSARAMLGSWKLLFALDVASARLDGILPAPFSGEPQWAVSAARVLEHARVAADEARAQLSAVCLLVGMLRIADGSLRAAFAAIRSDPEEAVAKILAALPVASPSRRPSRHYHEVLGAARAAAKAEGEVYVEERHLAGALLDVRSTALDGVFSLLGTDRATLRAHAPKSHDSTDSTQDSSSIFPIT